MNFTRCAKKFMIIGSSIFCDKKSCVMESSKLMEDLITYMDKKIHDENYKIKMVLDFGHDVTVGPMQLFMFQAFDVDYTVCSFSCNIFFELHKKLSKDNKERYFVRYLVDDDLRLNIPYAEFKKNVLNNIRTQKKLDIFRQEHKKRHKDISTGVGRRRTKHRLSKVGKRDNRLSVTSKSGAERMPESYSENKNRRYTYDTNPSLKYKNNNIANNNIISNNNATNIKMNAKSVDKENKDKFNKEKKKINSMQATDMLEGMKFEEEKDLDKGGFNYFSNDDKNLANNKQNNINLKKGVDIIEERPEDEEKDREHKYKKRELKLPNKYVTNIKTNNIQTNNAGNTNSIASRAYAYKRPIAGNKKLP